MTYIKSLLLASFLVLISCKQELPVVIISTSLGEIWLEIDTANAPVTAGNFLYHTKTGSFEDAAFYRVVRMDNQPRNDVKIEVIQGGLVEPPAGVKNIRHESTVETGLKHLEGTISMARLEPGTASTEFFICVGDQPALDYGGERNPDGQGFAAFGRVVKGMDVVRKIQQMEDREQMLVDPVPFSVK